MRALFNGYLNTPLIVRVSIALVLGLIVGLLGGQQAADWLAPLGESRAARLKQAARFC